MRIVLVTHDVGDPMGKAGRVILLFGKVDEGRVPMPEAPAVSLHNGRISGDAQHYPRAKKRTPAPDSATSSPIGPPLKCCDVNEVQRSSAEEYPGAGANKTLAYLEPAHRVRDALGVCLSSRRIPIDHKH
jgi:hypothetical protein